jgi:predicted ATPase
MIVSAAFKNFLALRDVQIDLEPFTVIVGPNACGKSTVLEGLYRFCNIQNGSIYSLIEGGDGFPRAQHPLQSPTTALSRGAPENIEFHIFLSNPDHITINFTKNTFQDWIVNLNTSFENTSVSIPYGNYDLPDKLRELINNLPESIILRPNGSQMSRASYSPRSQPYLEHDGAGLATVCANLQLEQPKTFKIIQESLRQVIPSVEQFRIRRVEVQPANYVNVAKPVTSNDLASRTVVVGDELIFDFKDAVDIPAANVSEGTLIALAILVAAAGNPGHQLVLLDDLERGLHPRATRDLIQALRALQQTNPNLQIVATTHSPYILNRLEPNEVRVATLEPGRGTLIAKLEDHPDFERWNEEMLPGELWSNVGEDWVRNLQKT